MPVVISGVNYDVHKGALFDGAVQALRLVHGRSLSENVEYCGFIAYEKSSQELVILSPERGDHSGCSSNKPGPTHILVASFHSQGATDVRKNSERPSYVDMTADTQDSTVGYVSTPKGGLWFVDPRSRRVYQLCIEGCMSGRERITARITRTIDAFRLKQLDKMGAK